MAQRMPHITTSQGAPVFNNQDSITSGPNGPTVLGDFHLIDKLAHFDRERIPERVVHAKGAGAHGYFEVTDDITKYCKAKVFSSIGKRTPIFVRFSTVGGEKGSADTARDPRGFAIKFYTEEGNWDIVGNNTPVFFIRDAIKFPDFIHTQKRNPKNNLHDADMFWDFLSLSPESIHQVTILFSSRGTPDGYRYMNGYSSHTFKMINSSDEVFYVKMHIKTDQGIKNLTAEEALRLSATDPDYATRDLYNSIDNGIYPSWTFYIQVMPVSYASRYTIDVLDVTKVWPHKDFPLQRIGKLILNRNPKDYYQEVEQAAFSPGHIIPGIDISEDKMLQGRLFSYPDTHRHRLGANYDQLPINSPKCPVNAYHIRDGPMSINKNNYNYPNYEPNSVDAAPIEAKQNNISNTSTYVSGYVQQYHKNITVDDFFQAGELYRRVMDEKEKEALTTNIANHLKDAKISIQERQVKLFYRADPDYGLRVARKLGLSIDMSGKL